jgi:hypothetical protein
MTTTTTTTVATVAPNAMSLEGITRLRAMLCKGFSTLLFAARVEEVSRHVGAPPVRVWKESYPSGGGSSYARWESVVFGAVRLQTGGWCPYTEREFSRLPY